ncbi:MAG TPA: biosynthetic peptidoglycan transglycosylase [Sphingomicrobium sp.]|nr:biosynthetic peptidoglycan transglycosylase [Sphingomicrobium sp.]
MVAAGFFGSILSSDRGVEALTQFLREGTSLSEVASYSTVTAIALIALKYFAELQRRATHSARKIVVLRRMLGVDYGNVEKVMPTDTLEGANEPYALHMFPGWGAISSLAPLVVAPFAAVLILILLRLFADVPTSSSAELHRALDGGSTAAVLAAGGYGAAMLAAFRWWLLEKWENGRYLIGRTIGKALGCPLKERMGHVLYRMELSAFETRRVGIDLQRFYPFVIHIEDKRFYGHHGNDWRAIARALWYRFRFGFLSGGSTITQQLFRSNCLRKIQRRWTRKIVEWVMAPWLDARYTKPELLDMYLSSVRYDKGIIGLPAALEHFFGERFSSKSYWAPSPAQAVFLVERLSNVSRTVSPNRLKALVRSLETAKLLSYADVSDLEFLYKEMIKDGYVRGNPEDLRLQTGAPSTEREAATHRPLGSA